MFPTSTLGAVIVSLRPYQWVKNILVFGGLIFSRSLAHGDALLLSLAAFVLFCMASSGVYLLNDLRDLREDRLHPIKSRRPLAAGLISPRTALAISISLLIVSVTAAVALRPSFAIILGAYLAMNISYSLGLKKLVIIDVMIVAMGFVLRAIAGAVAIGVKASGWLILCTPSCVAGWLCEIRDGDTDAEA
jgi:4-hydroxybenzoate polyprenyltransferase